MKISDFCYLVDNGINLEIGSQFKGFVVTKIERHHDFLLIILENINYCI